MPPILSPEKEPDWDRDPDSLLKDGSDKKPIEAAYEAQEIFLDSLGQLDDINAGMDSPIARIGVQNNI